MTCDSGPPEHHRAALVDGVGVFGLASTMPPRGPRSDLCVVVVVTWACGTGSSSPVNTLPATRPAKCAMSTISVAPTSSAISRIVAKLIRPRVSGVAGDDDQRLELTRRGRDRVRSRPDPVSDRCRRLRWWNILPEMLGRKPWVRWPPASSDMPSSRWLPSLARSVSQSASDKSLTCLTPASARPAPRPGWPRSPSMRRGWRRCPNGAARRHAARRTARGHARRRCFRRCRRSGIRRRTAVRWCPRRTCRTARCPGQQHRRGDEVLTGDHLQGVPLPAEFLARQLGDIAVRLRRAGRTLRTSADDGLVGASTGRGGHGAPVYPSRCLWPAQPSGMCRVPATLALCRG